jgi:hypothetical protein
VWPCVVLPLQKYRVICCAQIRVRVLIREFPTDPPFERLPCFFLFFLLHRPPVQHGLVVTIVLVAQLKLLEPSIEHRGTEDGACTHDVCTDTRVFVSSRDAYMVARRCFFATGPGTFSPTFRGKHEVSCLHACLP